MQSQSLFRTVVWGATFLATAACVQNTSAQEVGSLQAHFSQATLTVDGRTLQPLRIRERWPDEHFVGDLAVSLRENTVKGTSIASGEERWLADSEDGLPLQWLAADSDVAYLRISPLDENGFSRENAGPPSVLRLDLETGQWRKPLPIPIDEQEAKYVGSVSAVFPNEHGILALNMTTDPDAKWGDNPNISYRLTGFGKDSTDVVWSRVHPSAGSRKMPGAFLIGSLGPAYDGQGNDLITRLGENVLVCAGPKEDLMAIDPRDGSEVWRIRRLWEFRRGFIGPSVWSYFIGRYGFEQRDLEHAERQNAVLNDTGRDREVPGSLTDSINQSRQRIEHQPQAIIAGPVVAKAQPFEDDDDEEDDDDRFSIFVVVARSESGMWTGYLSDCVVYEFDQDGKPIGIVTLPKMVRAADFHVVDDSVFWSCQDALAKLSAQDRPWWGMGGGDMVSRLSWYESPPGPREFEVWMEQGWINDVAAFTDTHAFRPAGGGFVQNRKDQICRFPVSAVDLQTGADRTVTLNVPFQGTIPLPTSNYSRSGDHWVDYASFFLTMTGLKVRDRVLVLTLETESDAFDVEFDLKTIESSE